MVFRARSRRTALAVAAVVMTAGLAACSPTLSLEPAEHAESPECAAVIVSLPEMIGTEAERRTTSSQATAAWGDPSSVTLRCGFPEMAPTTERCVPVGDVDWVLVHEEGLTSTFMSFGRTPATEVTVNTEFVTGVTALEAVSPAVARTTLSGACR